MKDGQAAERAHHRADDVSPIENPMPQSTAAADQCPLLGAVKLKLRPHSAG